MVYLIENMRAEDGQQHHNALIPEFHTSNNLAISDAPASLATIFGSHRLKRAVTARRLKEANLPASLVGTSGCGSDESPHVNNKTCFKQHQKKKKKEMSTEVSRRYVKQHSLLNHLQRDSSNVIPQRAQQPNSHTNQGTVAASTSLEANVKKRKLPSWATPVHVSHRSSAAHLQHRFRTSVQRRGLSCDRS